jgi:hypothetical protein
VLLRLSQVVGCGSCGLAVKIFGGKGVQFVRLVGYEDMVWWLAPGPREFWTIYELAVVP